MSFFFRQLCAKELSLKVVEEMERMAPVLLCKLEKIFPPGFFNPMQHMILHLPYEARMGGPVQHRWCYSIERCQKILRTKCKNNAKLKLPSQRHTFWRSCQTSHQNIILRIFLACIIHPHVTMLWKLTRTSAFSKGNSEVQVLQPSRPWIFKSGVLSCYMC